MVLVQQPLAQGRLPFFLLLTPFFSWLCSFYFWCGYNLVHLIQVVQITQKWCKLHTRLKPRTIASVISIYWRRKFILLLHWNLPNHSALHYILGTIEKPSMSRGARGVFIMFRPTMQDSLKSNNCGKSIFKKIKTKHIRESGACSWYYWSSCRFMGFLGGDFIIFRPNVE
jgi:hypothetical protein